MNEPIGKKLVTNANLFKGQPYGMKLSEYQEIVQFLNSPQSAPCYPERMSGGSSNSAGGNKKKLRCRMKNKRRGFKSKCSKYTVEKGVLYRLVKFASAKDTTMPESTGMIYRARVAKQGEVNESLFKQFHDEKGHIGQRQGRETLRQHWFFSGLQK